jgi:DNA-binding IscR family transcriptional regulator
MSTLCIVFIVNATETYRLEALIELAAAFPEPLTAVEIARRRRIPAPFLGRLLAGLARDGVVATSRGPRGGVRLVGSPKDTHLAGVLPAPADTAAGGAGVRWLAHRLAAARTGLLAETTLAELLAVERERRPEDDWQI